MPDELNEQLIKHLADAHSIEEQALTQLRRAPKIAGDPHIAAVFERHLVETENQERLIQRRLESHGADPSTIKDWAGRAGGVGMVLFAQFNPDTPGKLVDHAYSYEHMELAAYELLGRVAERAGDAETAAVAREIAGEEQEMANRLEGCFDAAVVASLREQDPENLDDQLNSYLADAHAIETQVTALLQKAPKVVGEARVAGLLSEHLEETREHERRVRERLDARGSSPSKVKDIGLRLAGFAQDAFFAAQPDTPAKLTGFAFAHEYLEAGAYELLERVASRAQDGETVELARSIAAEERAMGARLAECWDDVIDATLGAQGNATTAA